MHKSKVDLNQLSKGVTAFVGKDERPSNGNLFNSFHSATLLQVQ